MSHIDFIHNKVTALTKKFNTRDPFELCDCLNIYIHYKDLGVKLKAYYFYHSRVKNIVINNNTDIIIRRVLCAHELGHAILHNKLAAMHGFQELDLFGFAIPTEYEANLFAADLIIDDIELHTLLGDKEKSFFDIAKELCIPVELLAFKFYILESTGYCLESPCMFQSNFLKNIVL